MTRNHLLWQAGLALLPLALAASAASAASNITNSLTGFTGDSTVPATQTAVATAGFGFSEFGDATTKVSFGGTGATFGNVATVDETAGNAERNYMRTNDIDYANVSFTAEVSIVTPNIDIQDSYFGLGSGTANVDFFRTPDFASQNAAIMYWGENEVATPTVEVVLNNDGLGNDDSETAAPGLGNGTHRVRMSYDWFAKKATFSFDLNYAGGPFTADVTSPAASTVSLYSSGTGFPQEPGRIFFGGDQGATFKDFQVTVTSAPVIYGDFDHNGTITSSDWIILRNNLNRDLGGLSNQDAYFRGDLTSDVAVNFDDYVVFKRLYDLNNGAGGFAAMVAGVPEPSTLVMILFGAVAAIFVRPRISRN